MGPCLAKAHLFEQRHAGPAHHSLSLWPSPILDANGRPCGTGRISLGQATQFALHWARPCSTPEEAFIALECRMRRYPLNCRTHLPGRRCASKSCLRERMAVQRPGGRRTTQADTLRFARLNHPASPLTQPGTARPANQRQSQPNWSERHPQLLYQVTQAKGGRYKVFPLAPLQLGWLEPGNKREPRPRFLASFDQFRTSPPCSAFFCACRLSAYLGPEFARTTRTRGLVLASITPA